MEGFEETATNDSKRIISEIITHLNVLEEKINNMKTSIEEAKDLEIVNKLDIINLKNDIDKARMSMPSISPDLQERLEDLSKLAENSDKIEKLSRISQDMDNMRSELRKTDPSLLQRVMGDLDAFNERLSDLESERIPVPEKGNDNMALEKKVKDLENFLKTSKPGKIENADLRFLKDEMDSLKNSLKTLSKDLYESKKTPQTKTDGNLNNVKGVISSELKMFEKRIEDNINGFRRDVEGMKNNMKLLEKEGSQTKKGTKTKGGVGLKDIKDIVETQSTYLEGKIDDINSILKKETKSMWDSIEDLEKSFSQSKSMPHPPPPKTTSSKEVKSMIDSEIREVEENLNEKVNEMEKSIKDVYKQISMMSEKSRIQKDTKIKGSNTDEIERKIDNFQKILNDDIANIMDEIKDLSTEISLIKKSSTQISGKYDKHMQKMRSDMERKIMNIERIKSVNDPKTTDRELEFIKSNIQNMKKSMESESTKMLTKKCKKCGNKMKKEAKFCGKCGNKV